MGQIIKCIEDWSEFSDINTAEHIQPGYTVLGMIVKADLETRSEQYKDEYSCTQYKDIYFTTDTVQYIQGKGKEEYVDELKERNSDLQTRYNQSYSENTKLTNENKELVDKLDKTRGSLGNFENRVKDLNISVKMLEEERNSYKKKLDALKDAIGADLAMREILRGDS